ncbi:hypothetical protein MMC10_006346 [Thelotrema lepadinum]|nr:hypothetical protein [Thelotrema lepadinum]
MEPRQSASFENLPWSIRHRIYDLLGSRRRCSVDLADEQSRLKGRPPPHLLHHKTKPKSTDLIPPFPVQLMRTCRFIFSELNTVIYGSHAFILCLHKKTGKSLLEKLSPTSLAKITDLLIHFDNLKQHGLNDFLTACGILAKAANLPKLNLTVYGNNVSDEFINVPRLAFSKLSGIRACNIRLSRNRLDTLGEPLLDRSRLLKQFSVAATGGVSAESFRFTQLPVELQHEVLRHTGLVVPFRPVGKPQGLEVVAGSPRFKDNDTVACCGNCTGSSDWLVCCCLSIFTNDAYSASCTCYRFPLGLLELNDSLSEMAHNVICAENRIILRGDPACSGSWLLSQPLSRLAKIRSLDILLMSRDLCRFAEPWYRNAFFAQWEDLVYSLGKRLKVSNLALCIDASSGHEELVGDRPNQKLLNLHQTEALEDLLMSLISPLATDTSEFRSLRSFFVYWPFDGPLESKAEKSVMGENYKSEAHGKIKYNNRDWRLPHGWEGHDQDTIRVK